MKKLLILFLVPMIAFAQFGPTDGTTKSIDKIISESEDDLLLSPNDKVDVDYFTGEKALQSTADGELEESAVTNTELGFVSGVTSSIQVQIDGKQPTINGVDGDIYFWNSGLANLGIGTIGQLLTVDALGFPSWQDAPISTTLDTKGQLQGFSTVNANVGPCTDDQILVYDAVEATGWKCSDVPATSPTTTLGDIIYNSLGTPSGDTRLPIGTDNQLLTVIAGVPGWADAPVSTTLSAKGEIQTHDGTANASFAPGTDGQVLVYDSATLTGLNHRDYSPLTTLGDLYVHNGTTEARLPIDTDGKVLTVASGEPAWISPAGNASSRIGDCKISLLDSTQFNSINDGTWVLMSGQSIAGSDLDTVFGISTLPNATGNSAFMRQQGSLSGSLRAYQADGFKSHSHRIFRSTGGGDNNNVPSYPTVGVTGESSGGEGYNGSTTANGLAELTGTNETRPRNIAVNFFCLISY